MKTVLGIIAAIGLLAGCSSGGSATSPTPQKISPRAEARALYLQRVQAIDPSLTVHRSMQLAEVVCGEAQSNELGDEGDLALVEAPDVGQLPSRARGDIVQAALLYSCRGFYDGGLFLDPGKYRH